MSQNQTEIIKKKTFGQSDTNALIKEKNLLTINFKVDKDVLAREL